MEPLIVVTYPEPIELAAKPIEHEAVPEGTVGVGYYYENSLIARNVVAPESMEAIQNILSTPVSVALAATVDEKGNIDGRICLVLPVDAQELEGEDPEEENAPWKASVPAPPPEIEESFDGSSFEEETEDAEARVVLLPIGNVVRSVEDRRHPDDAGNDAREMLENLLVGRVQDAVSKAIDDLLRSI